MTELLMLGLPTRDHVRQQLAPHLRPADIERIKWIRVAQQIPKLPAGSRIYMLQDAIVHLIDNQELDQALVRHRISCEAITPTRLAELLR